MPERRIPNFRVIQPSERMTLRPHRAVNLLLLAVVVWLAWGLRPRVDRELAGVYSSEKGFPELGLSADGTWGGFWVFQSRSPWREYRKTWSFEQGAVVLRQKEFSTPSYSLFPGGLIPLPDIVSQRLGLVYSRMGLEKGETQIWRFRPVRSADGAIELVSYQTGTGMESLLRKFSDADQIDRSSPQDLITAVELGIDIGGNQAVYRPDRSDNDNTGFLGWLCQFSVSADD